MHLESHTEITFFFYHVGNLRIFFHRFFFTCETETKNTSKHETKITILSQTKNNWVFKFSGCARARTISTRCSPIAPTHDIRSDQFRCLLPSEMSAGPWLTNTKTSKKFQVFPKTTMKERRNKIIDSVYDARAISIQYDHDFNSEEQLLMRHD